MMINQEEGTRQDAQRLPTAIGVRITLHRRKYDAVAVNLSERGLCLRTDAPVAPEDRITVAIPGGTGGPVKIKGQACWVFDAAPMMMPNYAFVAGIRFDDPEDDYLALVADQLGQFVENRHATRIPHTVRVDLRQGAGEWRATHALNLGHRGLFVRFDAPVAPHAALDARVFLPSIPKPIVARCEVVHILDTERAREVGAPPGIGLQITALAPADREAYRTYVDFLEDRLRL